jgi:hypothetical protein
MVLGWFSRKPSKVRLEDQLSVLAEYGISVRRGITLEHFLVSWGREEYGRDPFTLTLEMLGAEVETEPWGRRFSDHLWNLDTECIEDHGDYVIIAERMRDLAKGDLPISGIRDHVDIGAGVAWLEFEIDGGILHWDAAVRDDWIDPEMLGRFAALLSERRTEQRFTCLDLGGQNVLVGCCTPSELTVLRRRTKRDFKRLS